MRYAISICVALMVCGTINADERAKAAVAVAIAKCKQPPEVVTTYTQQTEVYYTPVVEPVYYNQPVYTYSVPRNQPVYSSGSTCYGSNCQPVPTRFFYRR